MSAIPKKQFICSSIGSNLEKGMLSSLRTPRLFLTCIFLLVVSLVRSQDTVTPVKKYKNLSMAEYCILTDNKEKLVLANFSADWCVLCKKQAPILRQLAKKYKDDLLILEIDMEENPLIAEFFEIDGLPAHILYSDSYMLWNRMGFQSFSELDNLIWSYKPKKEQKDPK